jgi:phenylpropionate dioxygenase-like ring-hydroxylating dioxygenase large terminal subunit
MLRLRLGPPSDFSGPGPWRVRRAGRPFEIRRARGEGLLALELACRHQNADLSAVAARDGLLVCPRHGWRYREADGSCLDAPDRPLRRFAVAEVDGALWIASQDNS